MEIECKICKNQNISFHQLSKHIVHTHNITGKIYFDLYYKKENDGICKNCNSTTNFIGLNAGYFKFCSLLCSNRNINTKNKSKFTCIKKYGVESPNQNQTVKNKKIETILKNWNEINPMKSKLIQKKLENTFLNKYKVTHNSKIKEVARKRREHRIQQISIQKFNGEPVFPTIGSNEKICLDEFQNIIQFQIHRNPQLIGYFPDGYIKELNLLIEFDEKFHFIDDWMTLTERDVIRENDLKK